MEGFMNRPRAVRGGSRTQAARTPAREESEARARRESAREHRHGEGLNAPSRHEQALDAPSRSGGGGGGGGGGDGGDGDNDDNNSDNDDNGGRAACPYDDGFSAPPAALLAALRQMFLPLRVTERGRRPYGVWLGAAAEDIFLRKRATADTLLIVLQARAHATGRADFCHALHGAFGGSWTAADCEALWSAIEWPLV